MSLGAGRNRLQQGFYWIARAVIAKLTVPSWAPTRRLTSRSETVLYFDTVGFADPPVLGRAPIRTVQSSRTRVNLNAFDLSP